MVLDKVQVVVRHEGRAILAQVAMATVEVVAMGAMALAVDGNRI